LDEERTMTLYNVNMVRQQIKTYEIEAENPTDLQEKGLWMFRKDMDSGMKPDFEGFEMCKVKKQ